MLEENLGTQAGVHLIEGVRLIWGPLNPSFTVEINRDYLKGAHLRIYYARAACFTLSLDLLKFCWDYC